MNFSSCGYTGLEMHPALKAAVAEAVHRYGTQFSTTRTFLSSPQYPAAEVALTEMFGRPTAISASTNMSTIPTLVGAWCGVRNCAGRCKRDQRWCHAWD